MGGPRFLTSLSLLGDASPVPEARCFGSAAFFRYCFRLTGVRDYRQALVGCQEENTRCCALTVSLTQHPAQKGLSVGAESGFRAPIGTFVMPSSNFRHALGVPRFDTMAER